MEVRSRKLEQQLGDQLAEGLEQAAQRARRLGRPALLRLSLGLGAGSALPGGSERGGLTGDFEMSDGERRSIAARGVALEGRFDGPERFRQARAFFESCREALVERSLDGAEPSSAPLLLAGFAFADQARDPDGAGLWDPWPAASLVLPRRLFLREGGAETRALLHRRVAPDADLAALRDELAAAIRRLPLPDENQEAELRPYPGGFEAEDEASWMARVEVVRAAARARYVDKVVLARGVLAERAGPGAWPRRALDALARVHPGALRFAITRGGAAFVGASPETLLRLEGRRLTSHALAGTGRRGADPEEDARLKAALLGSAKDQREHRLVARALIDGLWPLCTELNAAPEPRVHELAGARHLETPVQAILDPGLTIFDGIERLHPTPAVGGAPAHRAARWIGEREPLDRGWYSGLVGWVEPSGDGLMAVAIRSALVFRDKALVFAGAGIVEASDPAAEWRETELKLETMRSALGEGARS